MNDSFGPRVPLYVIGHDGENAVTNTVVVRGERPDSFEMMRRQEEVSRQIQEMNDQYLLDSFRTPVPPDFQFEAQPRPEPQPEPNATVKPDEAPKHPEEIAAQAVGNAVTLTGGAAGGIHRHFMEEADKLKNTISVNHDVQNGLTRVMVGIEQDKISSAELRDFYAKHPEALKEAVEEIAGNTAEVRQQHGDLSGKAYGIGMLAKITGGVSHVTDGLELGKRFGAAWDSGDWSPVVGQVTKIVGSAAAGAASMGLVRTIGLVAAGALGVTGGVALIGTAILGAAVSIGISVVADMVEKEISKSKNFDFGKQLSDQSAQYEDLAVVGNFKSSESLKLSAKNEMTLIGNQHFKSVELEGKDISVIGNVSADENVSFNSGNLQSYNDEAVKAMLAPQGGNPAEQIPQQPAETQTETANTVNGDEIRAALGLREEQYLDLEYLSRAAAKAGENPTEYALKIHNLAEELVHGQEFYDEYDEEWERITGMIPVPNQQAGLGNNAVYQAAPPVNPIPDDYEMPSI